MDSEYYKNVLENKTSILVLRPQNKKILSNRWVFRTKFNQNGEVEKFKTRLIVRVHTQGDRLRRTFAPVSRRSISTKPSEYICCIRERRDARLPNGCNVSIHTQGELSDEVYME